MDEATSNIDFMIEEKIQKSLEIYMKNSTRIIIAHRIKTILSCDKIIVLENGKIIEFDSPSNLLKNKNSFFSKLNKNPNFK